MRIFLFVTVISRDLTSVEILLLPKTYTYSRVNYQKMAECKKNSGSSVYT